MARLDERYHDNDRRNPNTSLSTFVKSSLGLATLAGIGIAGYKMGGPHGNILFRAVQEDALTSATRDFMKQSRRRHGRTRVKDLHGKIYQGKYRSGKDKWYSPGSFPKPRDVEAADRSIYGQIGVTDEQLINRARDEEAMLADVFTGSINRAEKPMRQIKGMSLADVPRPADVPTDGHLAAEIVLSRKRLQLIKDHMASDYKYNPNLPEGIIRPTIDITDPMYAESPYEKFDDIRKFHEFLLRTDNVYARKYNSAVRKVRQDVERRAVENIVSSPDRNTTLDPASLEYVGDATRQVNTTPGEVRSFFARYGKVSLIPDKSTQLYASSVSEPLSHEHIQKQIQRALQDKSAKNRLTRYAEQIKDLAQTLERVKSINPSKVGATYIKEVNYSVGNGVNRAYLMVGIERKQNTGSNKIVEIPIPVAEHGIQPNVRGIRSTPYADTTFIANVGSPTRLDQVRDINSTENIMGEVNRLFKSSKFHDFLDDENPTNFERDIIRSIENIQTRYSSPLTGESRDYIRAHQVRLIQFDNIFNARTAPKRTIHRLKEGYKGLKVLRDLKHRSKDYKILTLDLETVNLWEESPQFQAGSAATSIWQYGMVLSDADGRIENMRQIASDHVLREQYQFDEVWYNESKLRAALEGNDANAAKLKKFASYARRTMESYHQRPIQSDLEALIMYRDMIKKQAGASRSYVQNRFSGPIRNTGDFAALIKKEMIEIRKQAAREGKKLVVLTKNGTFFDLELLKTHLGGAGVSDIGIDNIDVDAIQRALTVGYHDDSPFNLTGHLNKYMTKAGMLDDQSIIDFDSDPEKYIRRLSNGAKAVVSTSKRTTVAEMLRGTVGKRITTHNSAVTDSVGTLSLLQLMKNFHADTSYFALKDLDQYISRAQTLDMKQMVDDQMQLEGWVFPYGDAQRFFSMSAVSTNQSSKFVGSMIHMGHLDPFSIFNPLNKDLHQKYRNDWVRLGDTLDPKSRRWMTRTAFEPASTITVREHMARAADADMNMLANKLQMNVIFTLGVSGGAEGQLEVTSDVFDSITAVSKRQVVLENLPQDAKLSGQLSSMYQDTINRAKKIAKAKGVSFSKDGGEITGGIWEEAAQQIRTEYELKDALPTIDPHSGIEAWFEEGGKKRVLKQQAPGKVVGLKIDSRPGASGNERFVADILYEASRDDLQEMAFNVEYARTMPKRLAVKSTELAYGRHKLLGPVHAHMNFDHLDKKYWGSLKKIMMGSALNATQYVMESGDFPHSRVIEARENYKKMAMMLQERSPFITQGKDGVIRFGTTDISTNPVHVAESVNRAVDIDTILSSFKLLGHEFVWDKESLERYYGMFTKGDFMEGRHKVNSMMKEMMDGLGSTANDLSQEIKQIMSTKELSTLIRHLDPLTIIEDDLRAQGKLKGGSIEAHWKMIGEPERQDLVSNARVPVFMRAVPNPLDQNQMRLGFVGYGVDTVPYGIFQGLGPKFDHQVKFQQEYFDFWLLNGTNLSKRTKDMLVNNIGYMKKPKALEVVRKYQRLEDIIKNNNISTELVRKHAVNVQQTQALISRHDTMKAAQRDIEYLGRTGNTAALEKISSAAVGIANAPESSAEFQATVLQEVEDLNQKTLQERLEHIRKAEAKNWYHATDIQGKWSKMAADHDNVFFLPFRMKGWDGQAGQPIEFGAERFEFIIDDLWNSVEMGYLHKQNVDVKSLKTMVKRVVENAKRDNVSKEKRLFDYTIGTDGRMKVSMAGLLLPADANVAGIAHSPPGVPGDYMRLTEQHQEIRDIMEGYNLLYNEHIRAKQTGNDMTPAHRRRLAAHQMKMLAWTLGVDKNSAIFKSNMSYVGGVQMLYQTADSVVANARTRLEQLNSGQLDGWLKNNPKYTRGALSDQLSRMSRTTNVGFVHSSVFFNDKLQFNTPGGGSISLARMMETMDKESVKFLEDVKVGKSLLPGGVMSRFPMPANGSISGIEFFLNSVPDELAELVGMQKGAIHFPMYLGQPIKADTDKDLLQVMLSSFSTIDEVQNLEKQTRESHRQLINHPNFRKWVDRYNQNSFYDAVTANEVGDRYARVGVISNDGVFSFEKRSPDSIGMEKFFQSLISKDMILASNLSSSSKVMERHLNTVATNAWSKRTIGLWTNLIRNRVHELYQANAGLVKDSRVMMELIGDLETGMTGMLQLSIKAGKHGDIEKVYQMSDAYLTLKNPLRASKENYLKSKQFFQGFYSDSYEYLAKDNPDLFQKKFERAGDIFDFIMYQSSAMDLAKKYDPRAAELMAGERGMLLGSQGLTFADRVTYKTHLERQVNDRLNSTLLASMDVALGRSYSALEGSDKAAMKMDLLDAFGLQTAEDSLDRAIRKRFAPNPRLSMATRKFGKAAGIGAAIFLAANFFRPNQMSSSLNPFDMFVDLGGARIDDDNNAFLTDIQLPKAVPLDSVNASFSRRAFIELNDSDLPGERKSNQGYFHGMIQSNILGSPDTYYFKTKPNITYSNYTRNIGSFNSYDMQRRSGML